MLAIAHRAPPTAAQCQALADLGAGVFEIDLQVLGGEVVVSHYLPVHPSLPRFRRDRWGFTTRARLPREIGLAAAVAVVPPAAELLLDLKNDRGAPAAELARLVAESDLDPARCHVSTHGWQVLAMLRERGFRTWRSVETPAALAAARAALPIADHAVTVRHALLTGPVVADLQAAGLRVMAWTVNDLARARVLAGFGVDGITSDSPAVLRFAAGA